MCDCVCITDFRKPGLSAPGNRVRWESHLLKYTQKSTQIVPVRVTYTVIYILAMISMSSSHFQQIKLALYNQALCEDILIHGLRSA